MPGYSLTTDKAWQLIRHSQGERLISCQENLPGFISCLTILENKKKIAEKMSEFHCQDFVLRSMSTNANHVRIWLRIIIIFIRGDIKKFLCQYRARILIPLTGFILEKC